MFVYVLIHDAHEIDWDVCSGGREIRGVYESRAVAEDAAPVKETVQRGRTTKSGLPDKRYNVGMITRTVHTLETEWDEKHPELYNWGCCTIEKHEVI